MNYDKLQNDTIDNERLDQYVTLQNEMISLAKQLRKLSIISEKNSDLKKEVWRPNNLPCLAIKNMETSHLKNCIMADSAGRIDIPTETLERMEEELYNRNENLLN